MQIKAWISFEYTEAKQSNIALKSLEPDNMNFINSYTDGNTLICNLNGDSLRTVLSTADDLLFCEMMVEKILEFTNDNKD